MSHFNATLEFEKDFKRLFKKYRTLDDDLEKLKEVLLGSPTGIGKNFVILYSSTSVKIVKARMACKALNNRSLRIVYPYLEQDKQFEFLELYAKGDKENENQQRIKQCLEQ